MFIFTILFLLSMVAFGISICLLLFKLIFKKGPGVKLLGITALSCVVLFIFSGILMPELTEEEKQDLAEKKQERQLASEEKEKAKEAEKAAELKEKEEREERAAVKKAEEERSAAAAKIEKEATEEQAKRETKEKEVAKLKAKEEAEIKEKQIAAKAEKKKKQAIKKDSPETRIKKILHESFGKKNSFNDNDSIKDIKYTAATKHAVISVYGKDNLWLIKDGMQEDITNSLKRIKNLDSVDSVDFNVLFPLQDTYGNESHDPVIKAQFSEETLKKINFKNFNFKNLPNVADSYWEHPAINK